MSIWVEPEEVEGCLKGNISDALKRAAFRMTLQDPFSRSRVQHITNHEIYTINLRFKIELTPAEVRQFFKEAADELR